MLTWLKRRSGGYLLIALTGFNPERFFNLCSSNSIEIWGIAYTGDGYRFYTTLKGFRRIRPFVHKSKVRLKILEKFGLPFFLYRNRKRKLFFTGFALFFVILYAMSLFIWDIQFEGNYKYTYDTLLNFFESRNLHYGMLKNRVDCDEIEEALRTEFSEITWVSARVSGTRLLVKIKENEVLSAIPEKDQTPCDIVADKPGTITSMIVRQGVPKVKVGDRVEQGQILVSGILPITDDAETVVNTHYVHSEADIFAETEYTYDKTFPKLHKEAAATGRTRNGYYLKLFRFSMLLMRKRPENTEWKLVMEERQMKLFQNFYLPIYVGEIRGEEFVTYERNYTQEELQEIAETLHEEFKKKLMEKGVQILENNVKILDNESDCHLVGHLTVNGRIGQNQSIEEPEETIESNERSGDHH